MNVIGYALKRFAKSLAQNPEKNLVKEYLQRLTFAMPYQARWTLPILLGIYKQKGVNAEIHRVIAWGAETCARRNDVGSLLWFLYASIFLGVKLSRSVIDQCFGISNELVDLTIVHGKKLNLFPFNLRNLQERYRNNDYSSPSWLPLYEVERRGWDSTSTFSKFGTCDDNNNMYQYLNSKGVEFYVTDPSFYVVEAFDGWGLEQTDFEERDFYRPNLDDFYSTFHSENYE